MTFKASSDPKRLGTFYILDFILIHSHKLHHNLKLPVGDFF